jgi:hypothetical protein
MITEYLQMIVVYTGFGIQELITFAILVIILLNIGKRDK